VSMVCFMEDILAGERHDVIIHDVKISFEVVSASSVRLYSVTNKGKSALKIKLDGNEDPTVLKPDQTRDYGGVECGLIQAVVGYESRTLLNERILLSYIKDVLANNPDNPVVSDVKKGDEKVNIPQVQVPAEPQVREPDKSDILKEEKPARKTVQEDPVKIPEVRSKPEVQVKTEPAVPQAKASGNKSDNGISGEKSSSTSLTQQSVREVKPRQKVLLETAVGDFISELDSGDFFFSKARTEELAEAVRNYKIGLDTCSTALQKVKFIKSRHIKTFLKQQKSDLSLNEKRINESVSSFMDKYQVKYEIDAPDACREKLAGLLSERSVLRNDLLDELENSMKVRVDTTVWIYLSIIIGIVVAVVLLSLRKVKSDESTSVTVKRNADGDDNGEPVVVLQKSHDILLKKQSLDDVRNNDSYYLLNSQDFCSGSAVRRMYLKNTCIKDIYNMYADDLRNPDKPNEDGCMVLGRWVQAPDDTTYDISLEYVVRPGDDAVFQEYELNFGGKIKMKMSEKLRKLRRETGLQYDLTCWVHSHPGLGVFFSNYDSSVQVQLKHPVHPHFLSAIVVDILTPGQDFGIFSFREDESIISGNELTRMYSLEELYKWAVNSERQNFRKEDYYNILEGAAAHTPECEGLEMGNNSIIDICSLVSEHPDPSKYEIYGYSYSVEGRNEIIVQNVSAVKMSDENEPVGCFYIGTHCSIPTIRRTLSEDIGKYRFVLFYSSVSEDITVIPITDGHLVADESYYSQNKLETLKLWTRRRR